MIVRFFCVFLLTLACFPSASLCAEDTCVDQAMSAEEMQEEIQFLMTDINRYIRRAEEHDREARRIRGHDRGYAMHLRKRAAWYRGKASYALDELKCLKEQLEAN